MTYIETMALGEDDDHEGFSIHRMNWDNNSVWLEYNKQQVSDSLEWIVQLYSDIIVKKKGSSHIEQVKEIVKRYPPEMKVCHMMVNLSMTLQSAESHGWFDHQIG